MALWRITPLLLGAAAACGPAPLLPAERSEGSITNGTKHGGHPAVGKLIFALTGGTKQDGACTATLVGKKTVLTAAHCLGYPLTAFVAGSDVFEAASVAIHSKWTKKKPYEYDLGLVLLKKAPTVTPIPVSFGPPVVGTPVTMIGFGETSKGAGDNNIKRIAANKIGSVKALYFQVAGASGARGNACYGDSGGPALITAGAKEVVGGVLSYIVGNCGDLTYITRLDIYRPWLVSKSGGDIGDLDTLGPTVTITAPADGATTDPLVTLKASATDNLGVVAVEASVDGEKQQELSTPPYDFVLTLQDGPHTLAVTARDAAGNHGVASVQITVGDPGVRGEDGCALGSSGDRRGTGAGGLAALFLAVIACRRGRRCSRRT